VYNSTGKLSDASNNREDDDPYQMNNKKKLVKPPRIEEIEDHLDFPKNPVFFHEQLYRTYKANSPPSPHYYNPMQDTNDY